MQHQRDENLLQDEIRVLDQAEDASKGQIQARSRETD
jgi:hypothetical protein